MKILRCGLIGDHISQTRFPAALSMMCKASSIKLEFDLIDTADLKAFDFARTVEELRTKGWDGVTITHPYKQAAADYIGNALSPEIQKLGASNTLIFGTSVDGFNTDYSGFLSAWRTNMGARSVGTVAMAGAGGVARALGPALVSLGAREIRICDISVDRATDLANRIGPCAKVVPPGQWADAIRDADGLVNATPMGMAFNPGSAFPPDLIGSQTWAFDAVYTPTDTRFLTTCTNARLKILTGFDLFRHMAMLSFQVYTGLTPDPLKTLSQLAVLRPD